MTRAIASIRRQTLAEWELVVVDDGSTDDTGNLLAVAARQDTRIRVIHQPAEGLVAALNTGLAAARGPLIARMDADDESHPERLTRQKALLDARPELKAHYEKKILLGEIGTPEDCAAAVGFLCSEAARYVTGHILTVDGGLTVGQVGRL